MYDVFISYARVDRHRIEPLVAALEEAGYSVWWDHEIAGGAAFAHEIERALNAARTVVVAWSVNSIKSEWVADEASAAKQAGKLVPIQLDATPAPIGYRQYQSIDFSEWSEDSQARVVSLLLRSLSRFTKRAHLNRGATEQSPDDWVLHRADALAVLPLDNHSGDSDQQFFVDGMHEALIMELSRLGALKVISRTSTKMYLGSEKSLSEIGAELGASKIIEGSVARFGNDVRISVQLIDAKTDTHLWAESFDRGMDNILRLQREIARAIAEEVRGILTPAETARLSNAPRVRPDAYEAYLRGMFHWYKLTPQDLQSAFKYFDEALASDPGYAPAYAGIAAAWAGLQQMGAAPTAIAAPKIKSAVDKALELDSNLAQAHFTLATYFTWAAWDWRRAEPAFRRAIELNPNFPDTHAYYAHYLCIVGRFDEAEVSVRRALDLDPFNPLIRLLYVVCLFIWDRIDPALEEAKAVLKSAPDHWLGFQIIRLIYHKKELFEESLDANRTLYTILNNPEVVEALDRGHAKGGYSQAMSEAATELAAQAETRFILPTQIANLFGYANEIDETIAWIEKAYEVRDPDLPYLKHLDRFPPQVMSDPRTQAIIRAMGYPED
jgi:adenylate cyclase